jgi:hypothetical protein
MIQRLQTVFLSLIVVLYGMLFFVPVFKLTVVMDGMELSSFRSLSNLTFLPIAAGVPAVIAVLAIFLYKNRKRQLLFTHLGMLLALVVFVVCIAFPGFMNETRSITQQGTATSFSLGTFIIALFPALFFFAARNIKKDEKLVKDADRLR